MKCDAVFEGGGVKGIGLVGAVAVTEELGYSFENVAGTSAGAIVAALIAAGYKANQLKEILKELDYRRFKDKGVVDRIPGAGILLSLIFEKGIYEGRFFAKWLRGLLEAAPGGPVRTFGDLIRDEATADLRYRYRLQVIAADLSRGELVRLPMDADAYGIEPDKLDVTAAVRMSMSIPFFYEPVVLKDSDGRKCYIVDGGILSNFPVWLFDVDSGDPEWPTFGYKLVDPKEDQPNRIRGPVSLFGAMFTTMMGAHDARYIKDSDFVRTIPVPTGDVRTTDFDLSREKSEELYRSGETAARKFFKRWDFGKYKSEYRKKEAPGRTERL